MISLVLNMPRGDIEVRPIFKDETKDRYPDRVEIFYDSHDGTVSEQKVFSLVPIEWENIKC